MTLYSNIAKAVVNDCVGFVAAVGRMYDSDKFSVGISRKEGLFREDTSEDKWRGCFWNHLDGRRQLGDLTMTVR